MRLRGGATALAVALASGVTLVACGGASPGIFYIGQGRPVLTSSTLG